MEIDIENIEFYSQDLRKKVTIGKYLKNLLMTLWKEKEQFNGKRPFGNSGWEFDIYAALIKGGAIIGEIDENGHVARLRDNHRQRADKLIERLIKNMTFED